MKRALVIAAMLALTACHNDAPAVSKGQSQMAAKAVADVDAATAEANAATLKQAGSGTNAPQ